ncbi:VCBS repeat-containing protein [Streptomyces sp. NPDC001595]|uniref:VCBS repeat-containing protein n=1 Tax=Streptomyces sp. NPDC001532 TaxID=3154520 RepID=UPI00331D66AC
MTSTSHRRARLALATGVALLAGAVTVPVAGAATPAATTATTATTPSPKRLHDDFNGDGHPDQAIGAPRSKVGTLANAGAISVVYGSASGLSTSRKQVLTWADRPTDRQFTWYGSSLHSGDLDRDGYADLLSMVNAPVNGYQGRVVVVHWGGPQGLSAAPTLLKDVPPHGSGGFAVADHDRDGNPDVVVSGERYGDPEQGDGLVLRGPFGRDGGGARSEPFTLVPGDELWYASGFAAGDITGDGYADLAVDAHHTDLDSGSGGVVLLTGGPSGFTYKGFVKDAQGRSMRADAIEVGDLNKDGYADIVIGHSIDGTDYDMDLPVKGGAVGVVYGGPNGVSTTRKPVWINQDTAGVPGAGEWSDGMGSGLSVADIDGDGYQDVTTGLPGEDFDGLTDAGSVLVLRGSAQGLTGTGAKVFSQNTAGVPGAAESGDRFGATTALVDPDQNKRHQLVVGDPAENANNGAVWVFAATSTGITATGATTFGATTMGAPVTGSAFGGSLSD